MIRFDILENVSVYAGAPPRVNRAGIRCVRGVCACMRRRLLTVCA
jgi:hypothetical protein